MRTISNHCVLCCFSVFLASLSPVNAQDLQLRSFRTFQHGDKAAFALAVDSTERFMAVGGADNRVTIFDLATSKKIRQWQPSQSMVVDLAFAPGKPLVASASYPNALTLFDIQKGEQVWQSKCVSPATRVAFSADGNTIGVASMIGRAMLYDATNGKLIAGIKQKLTASNGVAFSPDGKHVYVGAMPRKGMPGQATILKCSAATGEVLAEFGSHDGVMQRVNVSPSGQLLASVDREGSLKIWDLADGHQVQAWKLDVERLMHARFLDDDLLIAGAKDGFQILKIGQPKPLQLIELPGGVSHVVPLTSRGLIVSAVQKSIHLFSFNKAVLKPAAAIAKANDDKPMPETEVVFDELDNQPPRDVQLDGLLSPLDLSKLIGQPLVLKLKSGLLILDANLESLQFDRRGHGLRFLKYKLQSGRSVTVKSGDIYAMRIGRGSYRLRYYPPGKQLFLVDTRKANQAASGRLAASNDQLREWPEEEEQTDATNEHKKFLSDAAKTLQDVGTFRIDETDSTLIFTDLPEPVIAPLRRYVDIMNEQLNQMFGIPKGDSVWRGKAILAVFSSATRFAAFEEKVMNNPNHGGRGGVREGAKRFLQTAIVNKVSPDIARGLSWGYSLGFAKRLYSDAKGIPWLNMGIANAVQFAIVPNQKMQNAQRNRVIEQLKRHGSLLGLLRATKLEQDRWPTCGLLVQFLIATDPIAFGQMFRDTKRGVALEDALQQNYAMTFD